MILRLIGKLRHTEQRSAQRVLGASRVGMSSTSKEAPTVSPLSGLTLNNPKELYKEGEFQPDKDDGLNQVEIYTHKMRAIDPNLVYASTLLPDPAPKLPDNVAEVASLDPAMATWEEGHHYDQGKGRVVRIRQMVSRHSQAPTDNERTWIISFEDEGETAQRWRNTLMGWTSGADPMSCITNVLTFDSAKEAVYFAKLRGWKYIVDRPKLRPMRDDGAMYQDNFLPKAVAAKVIKDGVKCDHWSRPKAGASHYFRPLNYHGNGHVQQYGPNPDAPIAPECQSYYKMR